MYQVVDAAIVRAATHLPTMKVLPWPDLTGDSPQHVPGWRSWLDGVWAHDTLAAAIEVASPVLADRVRAVRAGQETRVRQIRRVVRSVMRYVVRATSRPTPFGLFAGVAPVRFGACAAIRVGSGHRAVARVDAVWLANVIRELERHPALLDRSTVIANNIHRVRDDRLVVGLRQSDKRPSLTQPPNPVEVSVRYTRPVAAALDAASSPIRFSDLVDKLVAGFPDTSGSAVRALLTRLVNEHVLITSRRPPMTATDPLGHVLDELTTARAHDLAEVAPSVELLRQIHAELREHNRTRTPALARARRHTAAKLMTQAGAVDRPVAVDTYVDLDITLPHTVAREAERAAGALARMTAHPLGHPAWRDYHTRFLERFGVNAAVPVLDLVDPDTGLGFPATYRGSVLNLPEPHVTERDAQLLALAQDAALDRRIEIELDDTKIADLAAGGLPQAQWQPHTELACRLHARDRAAVEAGAFELVVTWVFRGAGMTAGRLLDTLAPEDQRRMSAVYSDLPVLNDGALRVQLSSPPLQVRTEDVARSPAVLPHRIAISEFHQPIEYQLPLDDLVVVGDAHRLYLWSCSRQRMVEPELFNAVQFTNFTHPLARFLAEISTGLTASCAPFQWGAAGKLPFRPRLRYGRTILSPARWRLTVAACPNPGTAQSTWAANFARWRERSLCPDVVFLGASDERLQLDLNEQAHLALLRAELDRAGHAIIEEAPGKDALGWIDGRAHEIVIPLISTSPPTRPPIRRVPTAVRPIVVDHGRLPGASEWLYAKLYAHPDRHTAILTNHLPRLLSTFDSRVQWWFLPYRDPDDHLRIRFLLPDADEFGTVARRVGEWAAELRRHGLLGNLQLDTYYPETGRFGTGAAMRAAEQVFIADSRAALAQRGRGTSDLALTAATMVDIAIALIGDVEAGMRWLIDHIARRPHPALDRSTHDLALRLADPASWATALPNGEEVHRAWARRRDALVAYRQALHDTGERDIDDVLPTLLHLHSIRTAGIAPDAEHAALHLARAAALSWTSRNRGRR